MNTSLKTAAFLTGGVLMCVMPAVQANTWYTLNDQYQCANLGSPADRVRQLAAQGISAKPSGGEYRDGIVAVKYQTPKGESTGQFFYTTKAACEEMRNILVPVDSKYE